MFDFSRTVFFFALFAAVSWPIQLWLVTKAKKRAKYAVSVGGKSTFGFYSKLVVTIVAITLFISLATLSGILGSYNGFADVATNCVLVLWPSLMAIVTMKTYELIKSQNSKTA
jgi:hypothetical protein